MGRGCQRTRGRASRGERTAGTGSADLRARAVSAEEEDAGERALCGAEADMRDRFVSGRRANGDALAEAGEERSGRARKGAGPGCCWAAWVDLVSSFSFSFSFPNTLKLI